MSNEAIKVSQKGKRYSAEEKQEVVDFVENYNSENGRGGQSAASKQFGVSQLTIAGWLTAAGSSAASKKSKAAKAAKGGKRAKAVKAEKPAKGEKAVKVSTKGGFNAKLSTLLALSQEIEETEAELAKLNAKFKSLKASL
jgi:transposase-like protein